MQPNKLLTITDVCAELGVERHKASDLMKLMPCLVLPGSRTKRVREADLSAWITLNTVLPGTVPQKLHRKKQKTMPEIDLEYFEPDGRIKRRRKGG